mgnify:CR=1 FL=1
MMNNQFDEKAIRELTDASGGTFYRAQSSGVLWENIKEIDKLEKSEFSVTSYHEFFDRFEAWLFAAASLFLLDILLRTREIRKGP